MAQHEPKLSTTVQDGAAILDVAGIVVTFGKMRALNDISFTVARGSITALIGPNGAGKTTLFNAIAGNIRPASGTVAFNGRPITGTPPEKVAQLGLRRTFQNVRLLPEMTVEENVLVGMYLRASYGWLSALLRPPSVRKTEAALRREAMEALELFGLAGRAGEAAGNLPQGERRMLELARNVAAKPEMMLLDEPAAGLNEAESEQLGNSLGQIKEMGITVLLVEHDMQLVMGVAEHIVVLSYGEKLAEGTPADVQRNAKVIEAYLGQPTDKEDDRAASQ